MMELKQKPQRMMRVEAEPWTGAGPDRSRAIKQTNRSSSIYTGAGLEYE